MSTVQRLLMLSAILVISACATTTIPADKCPGDRQTLENCPPLDAVDDPELNAWYDARIALPARLSSTLVREVSS